MTYAPTNISTGVGDQRPARGVRTLLRRAAQRWLRRPTAASSRAVSRPAVPPCPPCSSTSVRACLSLSRVGFRRREDMRLARLRGHRLYSGVEAKEEMREMAILEPDLRSAIFGYLVFVTALLMTVIVSSGSIARSTFIVSVLAVSLPALIAWLYIESSGWMGPEPMCRIVRGVVVAIALTCSLVGFLATIWSFSRLGAFLVLVQIPLWYLAISAVAYIRDEAEPGT